MPVAVACQILLTASERHRLKKRAFGHKTPHQARLRAQVVLHAARDRSNARIARETGLHLDTVRRWRGLFAKLGLVGLADRKRSGRPPTFSALQVARAKALTCQLPAEAGTPLSRWSCPELAAELTAQGVSGPVSASTVRRWLREDALKPWQHRSWIFITDPGFRPKAERVLDLYARTWQGQALGADEYDISADEKTSIQARCRYHPTIAPGRARAMRVNHSYVRRGALAYLAAYDVHRARVFGRTEPRTGIAPFMNGSSHRGQKAADRLSAAFPNAVMVHTPVHAPQLNPVEMSLTRCGFHRVRSWVPVSFLGCFGGAGDGVGPVTSVVVAGRQAAEVFQAFDFGVVGGDDPAVGGLWPTQTGGNAGDPNAVSLAVSSDKCPDGVVNGSGIGRFDVSRSPTGVSTWFSVSARAPRRRKSGAGFHDGIVPGLEHEVDPSPNQLLGGFPGGIGMRRDCDRSNRNRHMHS